MVYYTVGTLKQVQKESVVKEHYSNDKIFRWTLEVASHWKSFLGS